MLFCFCKIKIKKLYMGAGVEKLIYQNVLNRDFEQSKPNTVYCTDITYLHYKDNSTGFLSAIKDLASGEIVSYKLSKTLKLDFVIKMLETAIKLTPDDKLDGLIIHSDRGVHFTSNVYQKLLTGLTQNKTFS